MITRVFWCRKGCEKSEPLIFLVEAESSALRYILCKDYLLVLLWNLNSEILQNIKR